MNANVDSLEPSERPISCLIVEDDAGFAQMLEEVVREEGGEAVACDSLTGAREWMRRRNFDAVVLDNHLPDGKGFNLYFELIKTYPGLTAIVLTGLPELAHAVQLTRHGLFDYLAKPIQRSAFVECFRRARVRVQHLQSALPAHEFVVRGPAMREVEQALRQAARHPTATVLLTGETGVGKDLAARALHRWTYAGRNPEPPFVALNCAALPAEMFEAELFGAQRGAYTGADKTREGLAGAAQDGSLMLDEIAEVPLHLQAKLLRFLESREFRPLGSTATKQFAGRFVAATNRSLREEVAKGTFREDLLYRLDVFAVRIPPLRERREEIPAIAETLLVQLARKYGRNPPQIRSEDYGPIQDYDFPGNARELRNLLERSLLRTALDGAWLALDLSWITLPAPSFAGQLELGAARSEPAPAEPLIPAERQLSPLELLEYRLIQKTLEEERGGIRRTAAKLGLTHQTLLRRLQKWPELRPKA